MKKTVVVIILAVYIASIAVVNFFGLEIKQYDGETYIGSIEITNAYFLGKNNQTLSYITDAAGNITYTFDFIPPAEGTVYDQEDEHNYNMIQLEYMLMSKDGLPMALDDDSMVKYIYDEKAGNIFYHNGTGSFVFMRPGMVTITLTSTDGHGAQTRIQILAKDPANT